MKQQIFRKVPQLAILALILALMLIGTVYAGETNTAAGAWLSDNWFPIAAVLFGALSEIIGMSPLKSNSVVQLMLGILGKIFARKVIALIIIGSMALAACGGTAALKTTQVTKETAETVLYEAKIMEMNGAIAAEKFAEVKQAYDSLRIAQGILIDARKDYLKSPTQDAQAAVTAALVEVASRSAEIANIAKKYGIGEGTLWK